MKNIKVIDNEYNISNYKKKEKKNISLIELLEIKNLHNSCYGCLCVPLHEMHNLNKKII
jgi:hypothetical protein